jgi:hypothetical protein
MIFKFWGIVFREGGWVLQTRPPSWGLLELWKKQEKGFLHKINPTV